MNGSTGVPARDEQPAAGDRPRRLPHRALLAVAVAVAVAAGLVVAGLLAGGGDDPAPSAADGSVATASPTPFPSQGPTSPPPAPADPSAVPATPDPAGSAEDPPPALPAVALDEPVPVGEVTASIARIEEIEGQATGPGDVAGPALRVTVRILNETDTDIALAGVSVNLAYGPESTPAAPLDDPSRRPFVGALAADDAADGIYVFRVPVELRDRVVIEVGYRAGAPLAIFSGPVD